MRTVPGFRGVIVTQATSVKMSDHRRTLRAARPVLAGAILRRSESGAVRLRSRQHVVPIRLIAGAVDDITLLAQRGLFRQVISTVQFGDVFGYHDAFGILPRALADAVASIHHRLTFRRLRRKISAPGFSSCAGSLRQRLAVIIRSGQATEVGATADTIGGDKETGSGRLPLRRLIGESGE